MEEVCLGEEEDEWGLLELIVDGEEHVNLNELKSLFHFFFFFFFFERASFFLIKPKHA